MTVKAKLITFTLSAISVALGSGIATANPAVTYGKTNENARATLNYWTPERLKNAKPMDLPSVDMTKITPIQLKEEDATPFSTQGAPPTIHVKPDETPLFSDAANNSTPALKDVGKKKIHFSSSRLVPETADLVYPYSAVGKLFFTIPGSGNFVCSASVLSNRLVVTAGHCVHSGSGGDAGFFTNWLFIPAYRDNTAPLQKWTWSYVNTTQAWMTGGGSVPNAGDFALLEMKDNTDATGQAVSIAAVAGKFGFEINKLSANHLHMLGYPCNFDSCQKMHQVTSQNGPGIRPNNVIYGSDMQGGSSGGPWVQNFGVASNGQTGGLNPVMNQVVAVTSWGYTDPTQLVQGASNFNSTFKTLYDQVCAHQPGNCSV